MKRVFAACLLAIGAIGIANAQQQLPPGISPGGGPVHYAYATLFGTGIYQLDDRTVAVFRIPVGFSIREMTDERFGMRMRIPIALGFHDYDPFRDLIPKEEQFATLSVVPGIEFPFMLGENWRLAPSAYLGFGTDLSSSERSVIYGTGITALRPLPVRYPEMHVGTALVLGGYESNKSAGDFLTRWSVGLDAKFPLNWQVADRNVFVGGHVIGYYYMNRLEFETIVNEPIRLRAELEVGIFVGARPEPQIFGIKINRLGIGYRFSDVSDAIVLFAGFPF